MRFHAIVNALLFQVAWFACIVGGAAYGLAVVTGMLILHWLFFSKNKGEWQAIVIVASIGIAMDAVLFHMRVLVVESATLFSPLWMMLLWVAFATTLNHAFRWLHPYWPLACLLGAVFGPFSYWAGVKLSDVQFGWSLNYAMALLSVVWAVFFPLALIVSRRLREL